MKKGGQFYLVSAIIVATVVISIVVVTNYSKKQEYSDLNSLRDEIQIEARNVLDYSLYNRETESTTSSRMQNFTQKYIDMESRDKDLYFIFGTRNNVILKGYQRNAHNVSLNGNVVTTSKGAFSGSTGGSSVNLQVDSDSHVFLINDGQNFYFILSKDIEGGKYVVTG